MDKYLKFDSETAMLEAMRSAGLLAVDEVGNEFVPFYHNGTTIDVVGLIVDTPAVMNEDGNITTEATFVEGWHVNLRGDIPVGLESYEIETPATPARVWV
jgi:hypothetical protein